MKLEKVSDIHVSHSSDIVRLVDQMRAGGGFMGKHLAIAADIVHRMSEDKECTKFLSFPAAPIATGLRGVIIDMIREGLVDVIITASGTLDHDIARTYSSYYHGEFEMDDTKLLKTGYHRLGNILIPLDNYGPLIEKKMQKWLDSLYSDGTRKITTEHLCRELGRELNSEGSLLYWAHKKKVPIFVPGIMDGAVGSQLWIFANRHSDFTVDVISDEKRLADIVFDSKRTGALVLGGGISKHHVIWWNLFKGGLDYACYVTTATEYDGSLSGAHVREAISWGKVKRRAKKVDLIAEATIALPFIASYAITKSRS